MPEEIRHPDGRLEHPTVRFEETDASLKWVVGLVIAAAVFGLVIFFAVTAFFNERRATLAEERQSRFPLGPGPAAHLPQEPRLEQIDRMSKDLRSNVFIREQDKLRLLNSYGPSKEKGFIHVPVRRAMEYLANRLPARNDALMARSLTAGRAVGFMPAPGQSWPSAVAAFSPGLEDLEADAFRWRQNGLLDGGEPNSGRLFNRRTAPWRGQ